MHIFIRKLAVMGAYFKLYMQQIVLVNRLE